MEDKKRLAKQKWARPIRLAALIIGLAGVFISIFFLLTAHVTSPPEAEIAVPALVLPSPSPILYPAAEPNLERIMLEKFAELYEQNPDIIGWIRIPGTAVDYPVLQSPASDWDFYLNRNFDKEHDLHGTLYIWPQHNVKEDDLIFIFGHNIGDGSRFTDVAKYIDRTFFEMHPIIEFSTLYAQGKYEIAFVFEVYVIENVNQYFYHQRRGIEDRAEFPYTFVTSWESEEAFWSFVDYSREHALYDTGIEVEYGDRMIALWTCTSPAIGEHRLVVVAVER